ncbi:MAG: ATP-dependent endonuclease [Acidobacteria bacterium]|nr:MAG: ATP-dependent endonuclease [Acidobacteriota bacterium]PYY07657.1 MAG: ATP-dependent endonuclease [Acidobacteriota bacterium]
MLLRKARVTNFKIVEDSNEFMLDRVTCLIGKNESGKTAILDALHRLNPYDAELSEYDKIEEYPRRYLLEYDERHRGREACVVTTSWELDDADVNAIEKALGPRTVTSREVDVYKRYHDKGTIWVISIDETRVIDHLVDAAGLDPEETARARRYRTVAELKRYLQTKFAAGSTSERENLVLDRIHGLRDQDPRKTAVAALRLPTFLYFSDYDLMSGTVALEDLLQRKGNNSGHLSPSETVFLAFLNFVGISLEEISSIEKFEPLKARLEAASNKITREMFEYWSQNRSLRVLFSLDAAQPGDPPPFNQGRILHTRIYNPLHEVSVKFDDRSRGFVWFFSFLVLFSQVRKSCGKNVIILLDEPGLSLHAKAQADLLRYIDERLKKDYQVIYTTHSPFMVDSNHLAGVLTVEDVVVEEGNGRVQPVGSKVTDFVCTTDRDTIFPLQGALGYEISKRLAVAEYSLIVESPSDLLYLTGFSEALKHRGRTHLSPQWTVCPVGGVDNVAAFVSLFGNKNLRVAVLVDYSLGEEKKGPTAVGRLKLLLDGHVLTLPLYVNKPEADMEDVIGWRNYLTLVNKAYGLVGSSELKDDEQAEARVAKVVEDKFRAMPSFGVGFSRYTASEYFIKHRDAVFNALPDVPPALDRFESIFKDLNNMLAGCVSESMAGSTGRSVA